ncbi:MAG: DUF2309 domain-containing protein [Polyangiales bacterium]
MASPRVSMRPSRPPQDEASRRADLRAALTEAAKSLPHQGALSNFVALNQLMLFQHMPFHEAIEHVRKRTGAEGYFSEARYREEFRRGRIDEADLSVALRLRRDLGTPEDLTSGMRDDVALSVQLTAEEVDSIALRYPIYRETPETLAWQTSERGLRRRFRTDVPEGLAAAMTNKSSAWARELLDRVGVDLTFRDAVEALVGYELPDAEPKRRKGFFARIFGGPADPVAALLDRLGIPEAKRQGYLALVDERCEAPGDAEARARYLAREHAAASPVLRATLEIGASLLELEELLAHDAEQLAVGTLHAHCSAIALPVSATYSDDPPLLTRVGRDRTVADLLGVVAGEHPGERVDPLMIRLCMSFLDQGSADWTLPGRKDGFLAATRSVLGHGLVSRGWIADATRELVTTHANTPAIDLVLASLDDLGVKPDTYTEYVERVLLALPGWAGLFHRLEHRPEELAVGAPRVSLMEYLAVRLVLERHAIREVASRHLGWNGPIRGITKYVRMKFGARVEPPDRSEFDAAHVLFQVSQLAGLATPELARLGMTERLFVVRRLERFDELERRRVWHEAYEQHVYRQFLGALDQNRRRVGPTATRPGKRPRFQLIFCMDDREESFRRHMEEQSDDFETWAVAGFFGVAIRYRALDDLESSALCPIVVDPRHEVDEVAEDGHEATFAIRKQRREVWAKFRSSVYRGTRTLPAGPILTAALGPLAVAPFTTRILAPTLAQKAVRRFEDRLFPMPHTKLTTTRDESKPKRDGELQIGFTTEEEIVRVRLTLENMGMVHHFGRLVVIVGHGSNSVNNPHLAAYDCGACGGRHGGPNGRAFAHMANRPEVRAGLREVGIDIPDDAHFIGAEHDTCSDTVILYDLENVPETHLGDLDQLRRALDVACELSAHERCRRFDSAPSDPSPEEALEHVRSRAVDLSQPRPELGHQGNAICVIGRRSLTQGLYLDRRAFLISYDPTTDPEGKILERILLAAGPVGAGISLQYYFALVDDARLGSGTKLPHNLAGLLGVMDGTLGDIKIGLPRQGVELHEPVRLLLVCEAETRHLATIYENQPAIQELVGNEWLHLVTIDPETGELHRFVRGHGFVPWKEETPQLATVRRSMDWYRGKGPDYLPLCFVGTDGRNPQPAAGHGEEAHA